MDNFLVLLIFFVMVIGPILRFYERWKKSRTDSLKNDSPHKEFVEGEFYAADRPQSTNQNAAGQRDESQPSGQIIIFEDYVFFLDESNQQIGDKVTTSLSGAQAKGEQYAENNKKAVNIYKFVAGKRIWIDKIYPPSLSN